MTTRYDVSSVPLQGGYVAKQCPVRAQNDSLHPAEPISPSPVLERRFERGRLFEAEIVADLHQLHPDAISVEGADSAALEVATSAAIVASVPADPGWTATERRDRKKGGQAGPPRRGARWRVPTRRHQAPYGARARRDAESPQHLLGARRTGA